MRRFSLTARYMDPERMATQADRDEAAVKGAIPEHAKDLSTTTSKDVFIRCSRCHMMQSLSYNAIVSYDTFHLFGVTLSVGHEPQRDEDHTDFRNFVVHLMSLSHAGDFRTSP